MAGAAAVSLAGSHPLTQRRRPIPLQHVIPRLAVPPSVPGLAATQQQARLRALHSRAARQTRRRARKDYRGLSRGQALALLAHRFPFAVKSRPWGGLRSRLHPGEQIIKYLDRYSARVRLRVGRGWRNAVVESTTPLLGQPASAAGSARAARQVAHAASAQAPAGSQPVDLSLLDRGSYFEPVSSGSQVQIPDQGNGTINFPGQGVGVHVLGADPSRATLLDGERIAYPSALSDTDLLVTPQDLGAELSWQARSSQSPQDVTLAFDLPSGATLQPSSSEAGGVDIVQGSTPVSTLHVPRAVDAAGNPVAASLHINGSEVVVHAGLGGADVQFPVYVDPILTQDSYRITTTGTGQRTNTPDPFTGWTFYTNDSTHLIGGKGVVNGTDPGLGVYNYTGTISDGAYGEWAYFAPANTFIARTDFGYMNFTPANNATGAPPSTYMCMVEGIFSFQHFAWEPGNYNAYINGNPAGVQYGPNAMGDCGSYSAAQNMPNGTFRSFCPGSYNGPMSWNYDGSFYNGGVATSSRLPTSPPPTQTANCSTGTNQNAAIFALQFFKTWNRTSSAIAQIYGVDVYLSSSTTPTIDTVKASSLPAPSTWVDKYQNTLKCDSAVSGVDCPVNGGPVARDAGLGIFAEKLVPPTGAATDFYAPPVGSTAGLCTGAPNHSPCPKAISGTAFSYDTTSWAEGSQTLNLYAYNPEFAVGSAPQKLLVDHNPPSPPALSGGLWSVRNDPATNPNGSSQSAPAQGLSYPLRIDSTDSASGIAEVDVQVDNGQASVFPGHCAGALCDKSSSTNYVFQSSQYPAGQHTITVTVKDWLGVDRPGAPGVAAHITKQTLTVWTKPPFTLGQAQDPLQNDQLGLEKFWDYRKIDTGAGSTARVNLGTGNLVWNDVPVVDPGQGLSTFVQVTYNSQHRLGELTPQTTLPGLPHFEYDQIGQGFSLGIDGLTRLNEPLDLSLASLPIPQVARVAFTDVDGTRHVFTADPNSAGHWLAPPGVFLDLREYDPSNTTNRERTWAITRPDGVTFFYDNLGYQSSIQDRHGNTITFTRAYSVLSLTTGNSSVCSAADVLALPLIGQGACTERVTDVKDQGGQDMTVGYYEPGKHDPDSTDPNQLIAPTDVRAWKIRDITDHAGRDLRFQYTGDNLASMTLNPGDQLPQKRQFTFQYGGQGGLGGDQNPGLASLPGLSLLDASLFPPGLTAIGDPNNSTTQICYQAPNSLSPIPCGAPPTPCPTDQPGLGGAIGALLALEPKCVSQITDRGAGKTSFAYANSTGAAGTAQAGQEIHIATVTGPRTVSGARPDQWIDQIDSIGRPFSQKDPLGRFTLEQWAPTNTLGQLTAAAGTSDETLTSFAYDANGRLTDRKGPSLDRSPHPDTNLREVQITYAHTAGTLIAPSGLDANQGFVSDPTSMIDQNGKTYTFQLDPLNAADGLITQVTDPTGAAWTTGYDRFGRVTAQATPGNPASAFSNFDANTGLPQTMTDPGSGGGVTRYAYDKLGDLLAVTDQRNPTGSVDPSAPSDNGTKSPYTTYFVYDDLSRATDQWISKDSTASPATFIHKTFSYDANDNLIARQDGNQQPYAYAYTPMDWPQTTIDPAGQQTTYTYDEQGNKLDQKLPLANAGQPGHETHWTYDGAGQRLVQDQVNTADVDHLTSWAYDNRGNQIGMADPAANAAAAGNPATMITNAEQNANPGNPASPTGTAWRTASTYNATDTAVQTVQNPGSVDGSTYFRTTRSQFDADGNLLAVQDARSSTTQPGSTPPASDGLGAFNLSNGNGTASTDHTSAYAYDARSLLSTSTDPANGTTRYIRRADGKICAIISPRGTAANTSTDCTSGGRANPFKTLYSYDPQGWLDTITLPQATNEYYYSPSDTMTIAYHRDPAGYPKTITDARGNTFTNTFYDTGELMSSSRPSWWTYDPQGQGVPGPDPNSGDTGQVSSDTPGGGLALRERTPQEIYQAASSAKAGALPTSAGQGNYGAVAGQAPPSLLPTAGKTSFTYDGEMRLQTISDTAGSATNLGYDPVGRLTSVTQPFDGSSSSTTSYTYDGDGNVASSTTPLTQTLNGAQRETTTYAYDQLDRQYRVTAPGSNPSSACPTPPIPPAGCAEPASSPEITTTAYTLSPGITVPGDSGNTKFKVAERVAVTDARGGSPGDPQHTRYRDYDATGNLIQSTSPLVQHAGDGLLSPGTAEITTYEYDQAGEQTRLVRPLGNVNLPSQDLTYSSTRAFDANGRVTTSSDAQRNPTSYSYDPNGNLLQVKRPGATNNATDQQITSYTYNGRDLRWSTQTGQSTDNSLRTTVTELDPNGNLRRTVAPAGVDQSDPAHPAAYKSYDGSYIDPTTSGASDPAPATAGADSNINATIRVYNPDNQLTNAYLPWGCPLTVNTQKSSCGQGQITDQHRYRQDYKLDSLGRTTSARQAYDWTSPHAGDPAQMANQTTTYHYQPNGWISTETDPTLSDTSLGAQPETSSYTYDAAGHETAWTLLGSTSSPTTTLQRTVARTYWPDGRLYQTSAAGSHVQPRDQRSYYLPTGERAVIQAAAGQYAAGETATLTYDNAGRLKSTNEKLLAATGQPTPAIYDTTQTYDANANVITRQSNGQLIAGMYVGGQTATYGYDHLDRETSMIVAPTALSGGASSCPTPLGQPQPCRTFTTSYNPSGQVSQRTRTQDGGQPITETYGYNDDGTIASDNRSSDNKTQAYSYDTNANRLTDERGSHSFNALNQETHWTRGGMDTQSPGSTVDYTLDGTGAVLQKVEHNFKSATNPDGSTVNATIDTTTQYCSQATASTTAVTNKDASGCQHDAGRVEDARSRQTGTYTASLNGVSQSTTTTTPTTYTYCYDALGNNTRITKSSCPSDPSQTSLQGGEDQNTTTIYAYDGFERLQQAIAPDPASGSTNPTIASTSYGYDGIDRRFQKTETRNGNPSTFTYSYLNLDPSISQETNINAAGNRVTSSYDYNATGQRLGVYRDNPQGSSNYRSYAVDANGSVEGLENSTQRPGSQIAASDRYHYDPYGELEQGAGQGGNDANNHQTPEQALSPDAQTNSYRFEGFYYDSGVKTYDLQARSYRPDSGQYLTQDRFEQALGDQQLAADPLTQNRYAFAGGNPVSNVEYDGHVCSETGNGACPLAERNKIISQLGPNPSVGCIAGCASSPSSNGSGGGGTPQAQAAGLVTDLAAALSNARTSAPSLVPRLQTALAAAQAAASQRAHTGGGGGVCSLPVIGIGCGLVEGGASFVGFAGTGLSNLATHPSRTIQHVGSDIGNVLTNIVNNPLGTLNNVLDHVGQCFDSQENLGRCGSLLAPGAILKAFKAARDLSAAEEGAGLTMEGRRLGHTFTQHGVGNTEQLLRQAAGSGQPVGQFLDDAAAERFIAAHVDQLGQGARSFDAPEGLGRIINPDGTFTPATRIRLVPSGSGVKTAYPEP
ncbi:MAG: hypothetical protein M3065_05645 [Actinomycetota bacterium]|nr:hypothetical protein [Actinomycetota bacterium]